MGQIQMKLIKCLLLFVALTTLCVNVSIAHDTTHIHPLITEKIARLIAVDDNSLGAYKDVYIEAPNELKNKTLPADLTQRLYWGTDFDAGKPSNELTKEWLLKDQLSKFTAPLNVINGVVQEDIPDSKVKNHFYQATSGEGLLTKFNTDVVNGVPSSGRAMDFFNRAIEYFSMYDESAKQVAFFVFGQALHHVEDIAFPAHIHNDAENVLFAPSRCCEPSQNTHVANSTLRFFEEPRTGWKQTGSFSGVVV